MDRTAFVTRTLACAWLRLASRGIRPASVCAVAGFTDGSGDRAGSLARHRCCAQPGADHRRRAHAGDTRGEVNGPAFLAGWVVGIAVLGAIVLLLAGGAQRQQARDSRDVGRASSRSSSACCWCCWRSSSGVGGPRRRRPELPKWMKTVDTFTPGRSVAMGVALSSVNPKNLLLVVGAATAIAQTGASTGDQAVALPGFIVIATLGVGAPGRDLLPDRRPGDPDPRRPPRLDGTRERDHHGRHLPGHRCQADRRCDQRARNLRMAPR